MSTTIESLQVEVQSGATSAVNGIDSLADSLRRLRAAVAPVSKGGMGLTSLSNSLQKFNNSLSGLSNLSVAKKQIEDIANALKPLENVQKSGFGSLASGLDKLVKVAPQLDAVTTALKNTNLDAFSEQCNRVAAAITPLATQMEKVSAGFSAFPAKIQRLLQGNTKLATSNGTLGSSYANLAAKISIAYVALTRIARVMASMMNDAIQWDGIAQRFSRSFGEYAQDSYSWIKRLNEELYINIQQFMQYSSIFASMLKGYGIAQKDAATMAIGYTELAYDIWAGYNDIYKSFDDAATAVRATIAGEVEQIRRAGFTIVDSQLALTAANHGVAYSTQNATEEMKSYLRYITLVDQANAQGLIGTYAREMNTAEGLIRTLKQQLISLAQAFGSIFLPILAKVLPYVQAFVQLITEAIVAVAALFGVEIQPVDFSKSAAGAEDLADSLGDASKKAKEFKSALLGIDELNVISPSVDAGGNAGGIGGGWGGIDIGKLWDENIFDEVNKQVDEIKKTLRELLPDVLAIGAAFLAWKIAKGVLKALEWLSTMKGFSSMFSIGFKVAGLGLFLDAWNTMKEAIQDIMENGTNFTNVTKLISGFAEGLGAAFLLFGNIKLAGASLIISRIAGIVSDISNMVNNGVNWENATSLVKNIGLFVAGIGLAFGNLQLGGIGLMISGVSLIIQNFHALVTGFTTGDWSDVNWIEIASGALMLVGGLILAFKTVNKIADVATLGKTTETIQSVTNTTSALDTTISTGLSPKLTSLAKNLGMGILIIGEVAIAAGLIVSAIWGLGLLLEQVGIAWQPVIDNGGTIAAAMGIGMGVLAVIGVVTALLGSVGTPLIINIALGTAILAELGIATGLFLIEIWAIGKGLDEIGKAWQPVLDNGETIAIAIGIGTGLLVGIGVVIAALGVATVASAGLLPLAIGLGTLILLELGAATLLFIAEIWAIGKSLDEMGKAWEPVLNNGESIELGIARGTQLLVAIGIVTAALGVASVASVGLLPLAIGLGTKLLVELSDATVKFIESIGNVANSLGNDLAPVLKNLNGKLPGLVADMSDFVDFMCVFAGEVARYAGASTIAGLSATIDTVIGWFTQDPIEKMSNDVNKIAGQAKALKEKLSIAVPELKAAVKLLGEYVTFVDELGKAAGAGGTVNLSEGLKVNLKTVGANIVTGFNDGIKSKYSTLQSTIIGWGVDVKAWFTDSSFGGVNKARFVYYAKETVDGFKIGIMSYYSNSKSSMTTWANNAKRYFTAIISYSTFYDIARDVVGGFNDGIEDHSYASRNVMTSWAYSTRDSFKAALDSNSPSKVFERIAEDTVRGYNIGITSLGKTTRGVVDTWANSFMSVNPVMSFAVDTSALRYYSSDSFAKSISANVTSSNRYTVDTGLTKELMKEAMMEALNDSRLAEDMRRQADKEEKTIVQIGNRTVTDAVTTQQKANGYVFAR